MNLTEKASYINGLVKGMDFDATSKEGQVIMALLDLVSDMSTAVSGLNDDVDQIYDELDAIDDDLTDVEDYVFGDEDEDDEDDSCSGCTGCDDDEEEDDEDNDADGKENGDIYEITCPNCGKVVYADEKMLNEENLCCPNCGVKWETEFDYEDEDSSAK